MFIAVVLVDVDLPYWTSNVEHIIAFTAIFSNIFTAHAQKRLLLNLRCKFRHQHSIPRPRQATQKNTKLGGMTCCKSCTKQSSMTCGNTVSKRGITLNRVSLMSTLRLTSDATVGDHVYVSVAGTFKNTCCEINVNLLDLPELSLITTT